MIIKSTKLNEVLDNKHVCKRCGHCCSFGSGALSDNDIKAIADYLRISEDELKEKYLETIERYNTTRFRPRLIRENGMPYGKCIFLDNNLCRIHEVKPIECRIGNCGPDGEKISIWFALNYYVDSDDPESIRQWASYLETHPTLKGGTLSELVPDRKMLMKMMNYSELRRKND